MANHSTAVSLLLMALAIHHAYALRVLEELSPAMQPSAIQAGAPSDDAVSPAVAAEIPPLAAGVGFGVGSAPAAAENADPHLALTFFMHDILSGSKPSARVVTGIVANSVAGGYIPFSRPNKDVFPIDDTLPLPTDAVSGVLGSNSLSYLTGLGGTSAGIAQSNGNLVNGNDHSNNNLPFVNGAGNLPEGTTLQEMFFGTTTVIDDELTEGKEIGSTVVGKAQGFYVASSEDGTSQTILFTAVLGGDGSADTLSFFGVHLTAAAESHVAVIGGTGKYENAGGYAAIQTERPADLHTTDGVETRLHISVYLS